VLLLGVGIRSVERIIEGEIEVARYLLLVWLPIFWLLFLEQLLVDAGDSLVSHPEDIFHGGWWCHGGILLLGVQRWLNLHCLPVLTVKLDGFQRQEGLERWWSLASGHGCH